jgi:hypothetical protein
VRRLDADLVGAELAAEERAHPDRGLDRLGGDQVAELDPFDPDRAGEVGIDDADPRGDATGGPERRREVLGPAAQPQRTGARNAEREYRRGGEHALFLASARRRDPGRGVGHAADDRDRT